MYFRLPYIEVRFWIAKKVDGITKYIEDHEFYFDNAFSDRETTEDVYRYSIYPTVNMIMNKGIVTCFAYGQTGSGKTFTMVIK